MEGVELALKNNVDDFSVDDLLDFSNDDVLVEDETEFNAQRKRVEGAAGLSNDKNTLQLTNELSTAVEEYGSLSLPTSELSVPMDDLADLEWLSNFVEDSFTPYSAPKSKPAWLTGNRRHPVNEESSTKPPLPIKTKSKRARTGIRDWSLLLTDSSSSSSSSSTGLPLTGVAFLDESAVKRQSKKKKRNPYEVLENVVETQTRCCTHCGVMKTPQWRTGPKGAKTLCNACGVRYKSGKLLPEYRPACSPTFCSELHSNSHRKVVEMRQKKETEMTRFEPGGGSVCVEVLKK